jgi:hypothetical protein
MRMDSLLYADAISVMSYVRPNNLHAVLVACIVVVNYAQERERELARPVIRDKP